MVRTSFNESNLLNSKRLFHLALASSKPPHAPSIFAKTTANGVPLNALLLTSSVSILCIGSSYIGGGTLWSWLQNIVGVSNQVSAPIVSLQISRFDILRLLTDRSLGYLSAWRACDSEELGCCKGGPWMIWHSVPAGLGRGGLRSW